MPEHNLLDEAKTLFEAGKVETAVVIFEKLASLGSAEAALRLSWIYGSGQHDEALKRITGVSRRRFFDDSPVGIVVLDSAGLIIDANAAFRRLVGEAGDDLTGGRRLLEFVDGEDSERIATHLAAPDPGLAPLDIRLEAGQRVEFYVGGPRSLPRDVVPPNKSVVKFLSSMFGLSAGDRVVRASLAAPPEPEVATGGGQNRRQGDEGP